MAGGVAWLPVPAVVPLELAVLAVVPAVPVAAVAGLEEEEPAAVAQD